MSHIHQVHVGDVGTVIVLTVYEDNEVKNISAAASLQILIKKPGGLVLTKDATFSTDGQDGKIQYTTESDGWTEEGRYEVRGHFVLNTWNGATSEMIVHAEAIE
jgi:hypothetical protein